MSSKEIIKLLEADGWVLRGVEGSHHHFKHPSKKGKVTVPHPNKDLTVKTVNNLETSWLKIASSSSLKEWS
ncbi:type II toxin-antitoxin system HicA family toxin [Fusobacterium polymorphum]